jgi:hypothetical protein
MLSIKNTPTAFNEFVASQKAPHVSSNLEIQAKYGQWLTIVTARFVSPTESIGENPSHVNSRICRSRWLKYTIVIGYSRHSNKGSYLLDVPSAKMVIQRERAAKQH